MMGQKSLNPFILSENRRALTGKDGWSEREITLAFIQYRSGTIIKV